jgi:hypothetical protein
MVKHADMEMTAMKEDIYIYTFLETGVLPHHAGARSTKDPRYEV